MADDRTPNATAATPAEQCWRGCSLAEVHRCLNEFELAHVEPVKPSDAHSVLHHFPIRAADNEPPRPLKAHLKWDADHVRLPCSPKSQYPVVGADGESTIESRWEMIEKALLRPIKTSHELQAAILSYNCKYDGQWNFRALHSLFETELDESETCVFFEDLLPRIIRLALRLPELVQAPIPLLKQNKSYSVTLTQQQVSCLLANAFLCTFPRRNTLKRKSEYSTFPDINFNRLYQSSGTSVQEKIKCICHYFRRVCPTDGIASNVPTGVVTFARRSLHYTDMPTWTESEAPLGATPLHITSEGTIEDQGLGLLQVDFANKYLGGGVLGSGCVQEEIRFVICPELLVSKLFTECLRPTEALLMVGCERFSDYSGYASSFQWDGNHEDLTPLDSSRRRLTHIVAIDALSFVQSSHQYREDLMLRELNKAYVGFLHPLKSPAPGVASGNWGCGAFGGEASLKALLQLMVCTVTKRPLAYFTFGNGQLRDEVHQMHTFFIERNVRVKDLWAALKDFKAQQSPDQDLYQFLYKKLGRDEESSPSTQNTPASKLSSGQQKDTSTGSTKASVEFKTEAVTGSRFEDIFDSSESERETKPSQDTVITIEDSSSAAIDASSQSRAALLDDSETDALLLAAVAAETTSAASAAAPKRTENEKKIPKISEGNGTGMRQRTLLEMLDDKYGTGESPASKRHCANQVP